MLDARHHRPLGRTVTFLAGLLQRATFLQNPRQILSRDQLCHTVWGYAFRGESNFIDVAIKDLRRKMVTASG